MTTITVQDQMTRLIWCAIDNDGLNGKDTKDIAELTKLSMATVRSILNKRKDMFERMENRGGGYWWRIRNGGTQSPLGDGMVQYVKNVCNEVNANEHLTTKSERHAHAMNYYNHLKENQPIKHGEIAKLVESLIKE